MKLNYTEVHIID